LHLLVKVESSLWSKSEISAFFLLVSKSLGIIVSGKLLLEFSNCISTKVSFFLFLSCCNHLIFEVHLINDDFIEWMPHVLSLNSGNGRVGFQIIE